MLKTGRFGVINFNVSLLRHTTEPSCVLKAARGHEAVTHKRMGVRPPSGVCILVEAVEK
jgi:hypothetical protein